MDSIERGGTGMTSQRTRQRLVQRLKERGIQHPKVLEAMRTTPRHLFLDEALAHRAYEETALPIGFGQTLSQPYIVALMTELLLVNCHGTKVLEVGTGSGYQAAVLASLFDKVYTVERIKSLQDKARQRIWNLSIRNVRFSHADGTLGLPEYCPYDGIISAAAPEHVPEDLLRQLAPGGVLIIPVGSERSQALRLIKREGNTANFDEHVLEPVHFVPLVPGVDRL